MARIILTPARRRSSPNLRADPTWSVVTAEDWAVVEICSGLICASLIPLRPLFKKLFARTEGKVLWFVHRKRHALPIHCCRGQDYKARMKEEADHNVDMLAIATCAGNGDIEKCGENRGSEVPMMHCESQQMLFPAPEKVLTRCYMNQ